MQATYQSKTQSNAPKQTCLAKDRKQRKWREKNEIQPVSNEPIRNGSGTESTKGRSVFEKNARIRTRGRH